MKGVMRASVSAGSSHRDASVTWSPQVIVPSGAAWAARGPRPPTAPHSRTRPSTTERVMDPSSPGLESPGLELQVLVGRGVRVARDQPEAGFLHAGSGAVQERQLPQVREHDLVVDELLHLVEDRLPFLPVQLRPLLAEEAVEVRVAAVNVGPARHHESLETRRRVPERSGGALDDVLELLLAVPLEEGRALQRTELDADTHRLQVIHDRLAQVRVGDVAVVFAAVEAVRTARPRPAPPGGRGGRPGGIGK